MTAVSIEPAERERLTLDAIEVVENIDSGEWTAGDAAALLGDDLTVGLVTYVNLLETMLLLTRGADVPAIRASCKVTAKAWRKADQ